MEIKISKSEKDAQERKELLKSMIKKEESTHEKVLALNAKRSSDPKYCTQGPFLRHIRTLDLRVPKHIITLDEKYIRRCLELVYDSAMRGTSYSSVLQNLPIQISTLSLNCTSDVGEFVSNFSLEDGTVANGSLGTITRRKGGINLLKSPLFRQSVGSGRALTDAKRSEFDNVSTCSDLSVSSFPKQEKKMDIFENERFRIGNEHKRSFSVSSAYNNLSGRSSFSSSGNFKKGMLHCTWKGRLPHYVLSLDDHNEIYIANIIKSQVPSIDGFDYMYTFYTNETYLLGRMRVSTSFKLCPNNLEIKETEFVLFGEDGRDLGEVQTSIGHNSRKSKGLSKVFRPSHLSREKASSNHPLTKERPLVDSSSNFSPNLELAAIIVKDHACVNHQEPNLGGWGMNFLKKIDSKKTSACYYFENNGNCSTSTNIIIPANFHGGPRDRIRGPSSLVDRWRFDGKCDCGGWDLGCPIKVLNTERNTEENLSQTDIKLAGVGDSDSVMKMVNIRDGLSVIHFKSDLSALQCLSIAVSVIHTQNLK